MCTYRPLSAIDGSNPLKQIIWLWERRDPLITWHLHQRERLVTWLQDTEGVTWPQVLQVRTEHWWRLDSPWASSAPAAACRHKQEAQNLLHMLSSVFHCWLRLRRSLPLLLFRCFLLNSALHETAAQTGAVQRGSGKLAHLYDSDWGNCDTKFACHSTPVGAAPTHHLLNSVTFSPFTQVPTQHDSSSFPFLGLLVSPVAGF